MNVLFSYGSSHDSTYAPLHHLCTTTPQRYVIERTVERGREGERTLHNHAISNPLGPSFLFLFYHMDLEASSHDSTYAPLHTPQIHVIECTVEIGREGERTLHNHAISNPLGPSFLFLF